VIDVSDIDKIVTKVDNKILINLFPDIFVSPQSYLVKLDENHIIRLFFMQNLGQVLTKSYFLFKL